MKAVLAEGSTAQGGKHRLFSGSGEVIIIRESGKIIIAGIKRDNNEILLKLKWFFAPSVRARELSLQISLGKLSLAE